MTATASLLVELERALQHGSREKRTETLRRVTDLFLDRADSFSDQLDFESRASESSS